MQKNIKLLILGSAIIWLLDAATKFLAQSSITGKINILPFVNLSLSHNENLAFGIPFPIFLTIILSLIAIGIFVYIFSKKTKDSKLAILSFSLLIGGALGNLSERIIFGSVTDFLQLGPIPNFNLADAALTIGVAILIIKHKKIFKEKI